jgi:DNA ligase D-like protein (predicted 3'-phosphoesterase)
MSQTPPVSRIDNQIILKAQTANLAHILHKKSTAMTDKNLNKYRQKRNFSKSQEPDGSKKSSSKKNIFVIQEHQARSHHFDFRIQSGDVLLSWAVPKGPSTNPKDKRMAQPTEDHPLDYAGFEGQIPEGEYGAGSVIVWDTGTYKNLRAEKEDDGADIDQSYKDGKIEIWLEGEKLKGGYALIKMKGRDAWMLIKMKDDEADARRNPVNTEKKSVKSGKTLKELEKERDA